MNKTTATTGSFKCDY